MKKGNYINLTLAALLLSSCSSLDFSNMPGYEWFEEEEKISLAKRRPIENLNTINTIAANQAIHKQKQDKFNKVNIYGGNRSYGQYTSPPGINRNPDVNAADVPDFRSQFRPVDPIASEQHSLYEGRFMSQKGAPPIPRGITPEGYTILQGEAIMPLPGQLGNAPGVTPPTNQLNQLNQLNSSANPPVLLNMGVTNTAGIESANINSVNVPLNTSQSQDGRRTPLLNHEIRMQLLSEVSNGNQVSHNDYPNLSTVPGRPSYESVNDGLSQVQNEMIDERNRIAKHLNIAKEPYNLAQEKNYGAALPSEIPERNQYVQYEPEVRENNISQNNNADGIRVIESSNKTHRPSADISDTPLSQSPGYPYGNMNSSRRSYGDNAINKRLPVIPGITPKTVTDYQSSQKRKSPQQDPPANIPILQQPAPPPSRQYEVITPGRPQLEKRTELPVENVRKARVAEVLDHVEVEEVKKDRNIALRKPQRRIRTLPESRYSGIRNGRQDYKNHNLGNNDDPFVYRY